MYGPVRTVVWEEGRREAPSNPILLTAADLKVCTCAGAPEGRRAAVAALQAIPDKRESP